MYVALIGQLERDLDGGGTVVGEEDAREIAGRDIDEGLGELHGGLVSGAGEEDVVELARLTLHRGHDFFAAVSVQASPPG